MGFHLQKVCCDRKTVKNYLLFDKTYNKTSHFLVFVPFFIFIMQKNKTLSVFEKNNKCALYENTIRRLHPIKHKNKALP